MKKYIILFLLSFVWIMQGMEEPQNKSSMNNRANNRISLMCQVRFLKGTHKGCFLYKETSQPSREVFYRYEQYNIFLNDDPKIREFLIAYPQFEGKIKTQIRADVNEFATQRLVNEEPSCDFCMDIYNDRMPVVPRGKIIP